jgi:putative FmdB family regulatory protein
MLRINHHVGEGIARARRQHPLKLKCDDYIHEGKEGRLIMPIYEYSCRHCQKNFEVLQKVSDSPVSECLHCQSPEVDKLVSAAGFRLKGGGWYETDFKTDADKKKNLTNANDSEAETKATNTEQVSVPATKAVTDTASVATKHSNAPVSSSSASSGSAGSSAE